MNPLHSMCSLHRRFGMLNGHREAARRIVAIVLLVYLGASLAAALGGFSLQPTAEVGPLLAWTQPLAVPQEWQWRGSVLALDPMFRQAFTARRLDWLDVFEWVLP